MFFNGPPPWHLSNFNIYVVFREAATVTTQQALQFQVRLTTMKSGMKVVSQVDFPPYDTPYPMSSNLDWDLAAFRQSRFQIGLSQLVIDSDARLSVHAMGFGAEQLVDRLLILQTPPLPPPLPPPSGIGLYRPQ